MTRYGLALLAMGCSSSSLVRATYHDAGMKDAGVADVVVAMDNSDRGSDAGASRFVDIFHSRLESPCYPTIECDAGNCPEPMFCDGICCLE